MGVPVIILGSSGKGKTYSIRGMDPSNTVLIQSVRKILPFGKPGEWTIWNKEHNKEGSIFVTDKHADIEQLFRVTRSRKVIIVDDFQYTMANEFMRRCSETGYTKFTEIGRNAWQLLNQAAALPDDMRVYFLWHEDTDNFGVTKTKTIGRMLEEKVTPEGMVSICLRAFHDDQGYHFQTQTNGSDPCKAPPGMFEGVVIDNDLKLVDDAICKYLGIK
jgi:hypothetical protein